jgi:hypothetical protein
MIASIAIPMLLNYYQVAVESARLGLGKFSRWIFAAFVTPFAPGKDLEFGVRLKYCTWSQSYDF